PRAPQYKALKAELAAIRSGRSTEPKTEPKVASEPKSKKGDHRAKQAKPPESKPKSTSADTIIANMERWRWMPHDIGATYVMVNVPDYTLKVVQNRKTVWTTKVV